MRSPEQNIQFRSTITAMVVIAAAVGGLLLVGLWGAGRDMGAIREASLRSELHRISFAGVRTARQIEAELQRHTPEPGALWRSDSQWLKNMQERLTMQLYPQEYLAVVDEAGVVILHSDAAQVGRPLTPNWKRGSAGTSRRDAEFAHTDCPVLTRGIPSCGVVIPIRFRNRQVAAYHSGFSESWFESRVQERQSLARRTWTLTIGLTLVIVLISAVVILRINRRSVALQQAVRMSHVKQLSDLGRLVGALAHEIRNPLNSIRLNLHALQNVLLGRGSLSRSDIQQTVEESNREIERLSELTRTMIGYARPDHAVAGEVDLTEELIALGRFLQSIMMRYRVAFDIELPESSVAVWIDSDRLRQILLNLVNNAREAAGHDGHVWLILSATENEVEIRVEDDGPGVPPGDRHRIFDAFYSTRETGTGLGLALVKRFVEEADGSITCADRVSPPPGGGASFVIRFPRLTLEPQSPQQGRVPTRETTGVT